MPPVFGPSSPSYGALEVPRRRERERVAAVADREQRQLLALEQLLDDERRRRSEPTARSAASSSACGPADEDALARREPVRLDDARRPRDRERRGGRDTGSLHAPPSRTPSSPRSARPRRSARRPAMPRGRSASATPATSGASGPTTTRSMSSERASASGPRRRPRAPGGTRRARRCPGLPGAACSSDSAGLCASFQASACSRPPDPTTRTFTRSCYARRRPDP